MNGAQELAAAIKRRAVQANEAAPTVSGADWRTATVATVQADGTVTTTDGIVARRLVAYQLPVVGDQIVISQSSSGSWLAVGRTAPPTGDDWQAPTLTSPWVNYSGAGGFQTARYRKAGQELIIEGLITSGGSSVSGTSNIFTLPPAYTPATSFAFGGLATTAIVRQLDVLDTGVVRFAGITAGVIAFISINCRVSLI